ncbi:hypothetical protein VKT23_020008 [Stygiomarasmius scandens]|uniref:Uncharacterized protein n=1 Tax=Marasmiellus scandens TaxID=2682957 RepID=A0ABR1IKA9_9AGAR
MPVFSLPRFWKSSYKYLATLTGPRDSINAVSFSPDGSFVSAVGYAGVTVWDLSNFQTLPTPPLAYDPANEQLVFMSCAWIHFHGVEKKVLVFGNSSGEIFFWLWDHIQERFTFALREDVDNGEHEPNLNKKPPQVASIDVLEPNIAHGQNAQIATSTTDRVVAVWSLTSNLEISNIFKVDMEKDYIPRTVHFVRSNQDVYVFARKGGSFWQLKAQTAELQWVKRDGPKTMGSVTVAKDQDLFVAWTGQHAHSYRLSTAAHICKFEGNAVSLFPSQKQVLLAEDGAVVIVGTDVSSAEVFQVDSGQLIQTLPYPRTSVVHYIAAHTLLKYHLITIAGSTSGQPCDVVVFRKKRRVNSRIRGTPSTGNSNVIFDLNLQFPITWTGVGWFALLSAVIIGVYSLAYFYSDAFIFTSEQSLYPFGIGLRVFVYVPFLAQFTSTYTDVQVAAQPEHITVTKISVVEYTTEYTHLQAFTVTETVSATIAVTEEYMTTITVAMPQTFTVTEILSTTVTEMNEQLSIFSGGLSVQDTEHV